MTTHQHGYHESNNTSTCVKTGLDYCDSLLAGTAGYQLDKLQHVQKMTCRIMTNLHKYDHISKNMKTLDLLRIHERMMYKTALLVYICRDGLAPKYLQELLPRPYTTEMVPEFFKNEQPKSWSFSAVHPHIWSTLPLQVKTAGTLEAFTTSLKTYPFKKSYNITEGSDNSNR